MVAILAFLSYTEFAESLYKQLEPGRKCDTLVAALTLDLKNSQKYDPEKRYTIQKYLIEIVDNLNNTFHASLLRELRFNGGDEMQGLFSDPGNAFLCLRLFHRSLHDIKFHAGIGIGEWSTVIEDRDTFYQDGSAYHRARKAIELSKKQKEYTAIICSETNKDPVLNAMLNSCFQLMYKNTTYQKALILLLECCYPIQSITPMDTSYLGKLPEIVSQASFNSQKTVLNEKAEQYQDSILENFSADSEKESTVNNSIIFQDAHPFGVATKIAELTESTRQSIDKALYATNVYTERAVALALLSELCTLQIK